MDLNELLGENNFALSSMSQKEENGKQHELMSFWVVRCVELKRQTTALSRCKTFGWLLANSLFFKWTNFFFEIVWSAVGQFKQEKCCCVFIFDSKPSSKSVETWKSIRLNCSCGSIWCLQLVIFSLSNWSSTFPSFNHSILFSINDDAPKLVPI